MSRTTPSTNGNDTHRARPRGGMVLRLRELLIHASRALAAEVRPGFPGPALVTVLLDTDPKVRVEYPSERP